MSICNSGDLWYYNTFIRKLKLSKWAGEPKCEGSVAHICKQTIKGNQSLFCGIHGSEKLAYICEIPKIRQNYSLFLILN